MNLQTALLTSPPPRFPTAFIADPNFDSEALCLAVYAARLGNSFTKRDWYSAYGEARWNSEKAISKMEEAGAIKMVGGRRELCKKRHRADKLYTLNWEHQFDGHLPGGKPEMPIPYLIPGLRCEEQRLFLTLQLPLKGLRAWGRSLDHLLSFCRVSKERINSLLDRAVRAGVVTCRQDEGRGVLQYRFDSHIPDESNLGVRPIFLPRIGKDSGPRRMGLDPKRDFGLVGKFQKPASLLAILDPFDPSAPLVSKLSDAVGTVIVATCLSSERVRAAMNSGLSDAYTQTREEAAEDLEEVQPPKALKGRPSLSGASQSVAQKVKSAATRVKGGAVNILQKAMGTAAARVPEAKKGEEPGKVSLASKASKAYLEWARVGGGLDSIQDKDHQALVLMGLYVFMCATFGKFTLAVNEKDVERVKSWLVWASTLQADTYDPQEALLAEEINGRPAKMFATGMLALFTKAYSGFTYNSRTIFGVGIGEGFDRYALAALRDLKRGHLYSKGSKNKHETWEEAWAAFDRAQRAAVQKLFPQPKELEPLVAESPSTGEPEVQAPAEVRPPRAVTPEEAQNLRLNARCNLSWERLTEEFEAKKAKEELAQKLEPLLQHCEDFEEEGYGFMRWDCVEAALAYSYLWEERGLGSEEPAWRYRFATNEERREFTRRKDEARIAKAKALRGDHDPLKMWSQR